MVDEQDDTPTRLLPAMHHPDTDSIQAILLAVRAVLSEVKGLNRKVEGVSSTINGHVTDIAVIKVQNQGQGDLLQSLTARVAALEDERDELARSVLAKAITLVLVLSAAVAAAIWFITHKAG